MFHENVISQFNAPQQLRESRQARSLERTIIDKSFGCVRPGEMLLVLARPGGGATTLLRLLSNQRKGYTSIEGDVRFGTLSPKEIKGFRGQVVMNGEEVSTKRHCRRAILICDLVYQELFFPSMTVGQTIAFATAVKTPADAMRTRQSKQEWRTRMSDFLLRSMGIAHTKDTKLGNEYIRGVSGGERKRVSIIEVLATKASVFCWDNSTRG